MEKIEQHGLRWRVHTAKILAEVMENRSCDVLRQPLLIFDDLLRQVAARAIELDDDKLNRLMLQLTLYSVADPTSPDYDAKVTSELIEGHARDRRSPASESSASGR